MTDKKKKNEPDIKFTDLGSSKVLGRGEAQSVEPKKPEIKIEIKKENQKNQKKNRDQKREPEKPEKK